MEEVKFSFNSLDVQTVKNGFILTLDRMHCTVNDLVYVFNTLEQLSDFIKNIDNPK